MLLCYLVVVDVVVVFVVFAVVVANAVPAVAIVDVVLSRALGPFGQNAAAPSFACVVGVSQWEKLEGR